ncbi:bifunctional glycosyltransferase/CDP-glycerol:glycerophosphate glycerophosphotransferase [Nonomuraea longicatena]
MYLAECLESISRQTLADIEVVCVDDGSPDGSAAIAEAMASRDPRFRLVRQDNQGLGPARNTGAALARGRYLAFADSDDVVPADAYGLLVSTLERTGSDFAAGNVECMNSTARWQSPMHAETFRQDVLKTHVSRQHDLLLDRTAWNKVYRRSFLDGTGLSFPAGLYEDAPVTVPAHVLATSVDVLKQVVYLWRQREGGERSITQQRTVPGNLEDRVRSVRTTRDFLRAHGDAEVGLAYDVYALQSDISVYLQQYAQSGSDYRSRFLAVVGPLVHDMDREVFRRLPWNQSLAFDLVRRGDGAALAELLLESVTGRRQRLVRGWRGWRVRHPLLPRAGAPATPADLRLIARVDGLTWHDERLQVSGYAYAPGLDLADPRDAELELALVNRRTEAQIPVPVRRVPRTDVTAASSHLTANYDASGFTAEIDPGILSHKGSWQLQLSLRRPGLRIESRCAAVGAARRFAGVKVHSALWMGVSGGDDVLVRLRKINATAEVRNLGAGELTLDGRITRKRTPSAAAVVLRARRGGHELRVPVEPAPHGEQLAFSASIPSRALAEPAVTGGSDVYWEVLLSVDDGEPVALMNPAASTHDRGLVGDREIAQVTGRDLQLGIVVREPRVLVTEVEWAEDGTLRVKGLNRVGADRPECLVLRRVGGGGSHRVPLSWDGPAFTAAFRPERLPVHGYETSLSTGQWEFAVTSENAPVLVRLDKSRRLPDERVVGVHEYGFRSRADGALVLWTRPSLSPDDGVRGRDTLRNTVYPAMLRRPVSDLLVFDVWRGRQYSDSPRAVFEELRRRGDRRECVWVSADGQVNPPGDARVVRKNSREHFEAMAGASHIFCNDNAPDWFVKRADQTYVQTWHGTPLKRIGFDLPVVHFDNGTDYLRRFGQDVAKWDLLLSPNSFSSPIFSRAFAYSGEILECGYPRNDLLHRAEGVSRAARVRDALGIPSGQRVVLYAPTWRDDHPAGGLELGLDLDTMRRALGDEHTLLVRGHIHTGGPVEPSRRVLDVTRYPDITELLLIADVLITDYSSVMFDYAGTGRPILFFTYDLEHYRDVLRGFYFDFEAEAPGPLLRTTDEIVDALRQVDEVAGKYAALHDAFADRFCHLDDGMAAARVVDHVL